MGWWLALSPQGAGAIAAAVGGAIYLAGLLIGGDVPEAIGIALGTTVFFGGCWYWHYRTGRS